MMNNKNIIYKKEKHIEISGADTTIVTNNKCPLTLEEATDAGVLLYLAEDEVMPCCTCNAYVHKKQEFTCIYFNRFIQDEKTKVNNIHCYHDRAEKLN